MALVPSGEVEEVRVSATQPPEQRTVNFHLGAAPQTAQRVQRARGEGAIAGVCRLCTRLVYDDQCARADTSAAVDSACPCGTLAVHGECLTRQMAEAPSSCKSLRWKCSLCDHELAWSIDAHSLLPPPGRIVQWVFGLWRMPFRLVWKLFSWTMNLALLVVACGYLHKLVAWVNHAIASTYRHRQITSPFVYQFTGPGVSGESIIISRGLSLDGTHMIFGIAALTNIVGIVFALWLVHRIVRFVYRRLPARLFYTLRPRIHT